MGGIFSQPNTNTVVVRNTDDDMEGSENMKKSDNQNVMDYTTSDESDESSISNRINIQDSVGNVNEKTDIPPTSESTFNFKSVNPTDEEHDIAVQTTDFNVELNKKQNKKYGNLHFISFLAVVLSRLAYCNDNAFLPNYVSIMGPIIDKKYLTAIDKIPYDQLYKLLDERTLFDIETNYVDVLEQQIPQKINSIIGDERPDKIMEYTPEFNKNMTSPNVKYISIGWSNYGEIYVVADKQMPNTIFLIFRGTYSAKTFSIYSKFTALTPYSVCKTNKEEQFLYGIFKVTTELIHTIIESITYLATTHLEQTNVNSVKIFTTGHSLGGAMSTIFAYLWMSIKKTSPYNKNPYNVLADQIICISAGSPRCMVQNVAKNFCDNVITTTSKNNTILFIRIVTKGDLVTGIPKWFGYRHPCSDDINMREQVVEECNSTMSVSLNNIDNKPTVFKLNYDNPLYCQANNPIRELIHDFIPHMNYLDIRFTKAVSFGNFTKGVVERTEVYRTKSDDTVCRLIMGTYNIDIRNTFNYKYVFFNVNNTRQNPTDKNDQKLDTALVELENDESALDFQEPSENNNTQGGNLSSWNPFSKKTDSTQVNPNPVKTSDKWSLTNWIKKKFSSLFTVDIQEDIRMTPDAYNKLISYMVEIQGGENNILKPQNGVSIYSPFNEKLMPNLSCKKKNQQGGVTRNPTSAFKSTKKLRKYKLMKKTKKNKSKKITHKYKSYKYKSHKRKNKHL